MKAPTIDLVTFEALRESVGPEFATELVDTFLVEAPTMLAELRTMLNAQDATSFRRAAHSLKSNSNTFGALALGAMARDLEVSIHVPVVTVSAGTLDALEDEYRRVAVALADLAHA